MVKLKLFNRLPVMYEIPKANIIVIIDNKLSASKFFKFDFIVLYPKHIINIKYGVNIKIKPIMPRA